MKNLEFVQSYKATCWGGLCSHILFFIKCHLNLYKNLYKDGLFISNFQCRHDTCICAGGSEECSGNLWHFGELQSIYQGGGGKSCTVLIRCPPPLPDPQIRSQKPPVRIFQIRGWLYCYDQRMHSGTNQVSYVLLWLVCYLVMADSSFCGSGGLWRSHWGYWQCLERSSKLFWHAK